MSIPRAGPADDDSASDSDEFQADYYEPISTEEGGEDCLVLNDDGYNRGGEDHHGISYHHANGHGGNAHENPNGFHNGVSSIESVRDGISTIDLVRENPVRGRGEVDQDDREEEEERLRAASETAILTAFMEDESRRSAPLSPERSSAVVNAMRNIRFDGLQPSWADQIPEDQWIDQLRQMRGPFANQS
ncbi:hypothetical protein EJ110_NYTH24218 [Nymphaea thermarum]|nr:hypothetical protein EJ110_NYTH24218 [Nymphaea thermarum]